RWAGRQRCSPHACGPTAAHVEATWSWALRLFATVLSATFLFATGLWANLRRSARAWTMNVRAICSAAAGL
ncbi:MAG: hypothetical protein ACR2OH_15325, partial [Microthrixaceae bacterium]